MINYLVNIWLNLARWALFTANVAIAPLKERDAAQRIAGLMHFSPDPVPDSEQQAIAGFLRLLRTAVGDQ